MPATAQPPPTRRSRVFHPTPLASYELTAVVWLRDLLQVVDRDVINCIERAEMNLVKLLLRAQAHQAIQLSSFMLHLVSTNYVPMRRRAEWALLRGDNLAHVEAHRWPPLSYLEAAAAWERKQQKLTAGWWGCVFTPSVQQDDLMKDWVGHSTRGEPIATDAIGLAYACESTEWVAELKALEEAGARTAEPRSRCALCRNTCRTVPTTKPKCRKRK
jgi:hypothetical protein